MSPSHLPSLRWLRAFEAAARHRSFTEAARELNLTQSAVSQHIRSLEAFLGTPLFERHPRSVTLTEDGASYLPTIREAFAILAAGTRSAHVARRTRVILQCNMGFATLRLVPRLGELAAACPGLRLDLVTPVWDPQRTASDAGVEIRYEYPVHGGDRRAPRRAETAYPVCSPQLGASIANGADWRRMPLFDCAGVLAGWPAWLSAHGEAAPVADLAHRTSTFAASIGAALAGSGLAMAHDTLVCELVAQGRLTRPFATSIEMREAYVLRRPAPQMRTPAAEALADWLEATFSSLSAQGPARPPGLPL